MNFSYWEKQTWLSNIDFAVIGSGIVGLNCALTLRKRYPKAKILVLEKGMLPQGASTKNAGFACFGSLSEIIEDLKSLPEDDVFNLIKKRVLGLELLRKNLGDKSIDYQRLGGFELFLRENAEEYQSCFDKMKKINKFLHPLFKGDIFQLKKNPFRFKDIVPNLFYNPFEGQIDTGKMMEALLHNAHSKNIKILNNVIVNNLSENRDSVAVETDQFSLKCLKAFIATNGFAKQLLNIDVKPARAQVLITKPIDNLHIKGAFHIDRGFYYFRNIDNRILFGGGRELDYETETTTAFGTTKKVQTRLDDLLKNIILPDTKFEIEHRWSGIMGVGNDKDPIVEPISDNIYCGVKLGGMGVAIGSLIGMELAEFA